MMFLKSLFAFLFPSISLAVCPVYDSNGYPAKNLNDGVFLLLENSHSCPSSVVEWNEKLNHSGLQHHPSMVANRGRNNPSMGSFSLFESVSGTIKDKAVSIENGEMFYGHFTDKKDNTLILDQTPAQGKLLIELIAWDYKKGAFNFYELRGLTTSSVRWFYRGDSLDALKDNEFLYRENGSQPKFGSRMRCSACHNSGGPIMKELSYPHNDWWTTQRALIFGNSQLDSSVADYVKALVPAEKFSNTVKNGIHKLESSSTYQQAKLKTSLQEQLRPLFCEQEINLESDLDPNSKMNGEIKIPSAFFLNPLLKKEFIKISRNEYENLLKKYDLKFPETKDIDSDYAWLTPVKGYSDLLAIESLVKNKVVSWNFVQSILQIEINSPLFSKKRCNLLKRISIAATHNWEQAFLSEIEQKLQQEPGNDFESAFMKLIKLRKSVYTSEISQNPRGQILEPGLRVIFPE